MAASERKEISVAPEKGQQQSLSRPNTLALTYLRVCLLLAGPGPQLSWCSRCWGRGASPLCPPPGLWGEAGVCQRGGDGRAWSAGAVHTRGLQPPSPLPPQDPPHSPSAPSPTSPSVAGVWLPRDMVPDQR